MGFSDLVKQAQTEKRTVLTEIESKNILREVGINTTETFLALSSEEANNKESEIDFSAGKIEINHKIQTLKVKFVGLSINKSEKNNYRYILENHQENWLENGTSRNASFQGLDPGEYEFIFTFFIEI